MLGQTCAKYPTGLQLCYQLQSRSGFAGWEPPGMYHEAILALLPVLRYSNPDFPHHTAGLLKYLRESTKLPLHSALDLGQPTLHQEGVF